VPGSLLSLRPRVAWVPGALFLLTSVVCLPGWLIKNDFDRNAAPQFVTLSISAGILGLLFITWRSRITLPIAVHVGIYALLITSSISLVTGHNLINGLTGDTGRYTGLVSLFALLAIALFFSQIDESQFAQFYPWLIAAFLIVDVLGIFQALGWITMPGDGGVGSTLGNLDFLSAWVGTSFPLFFWRRIKSRSHALVIGSIFALSLWLMIKIGAKQGLLDFIILIPVILIYLGRHRLKGLGLSIAVWTGIGSFVTILWAEAIYLVPMAKLPVPGIAGDPNVRIRTDFWFSGFGQFAHHILFGVGPDNYGNYYERYRSLSSVKLTESVLANDAHSSVVQTFATLGLASVLAFIVLLILYIRSLVVLINDDQRRWHGAVLAVFSLVYFTNSAISPITLPNKFLFWAVAGYVIGSAQRIRPLRVWTSEVATRAVVGVMAAVILFVTANFAWADYRFIYSGKGYSPSPYLPCTLYFSQELAKSTSDPTVALREAGAEAKNNPRCIEAQFLLANVNLKQNNLVAAKRPIYELLDIAPARHEVVRLAAIYALRAKDMYLQNLLIAQGLKLGVLTQS